MSEFQVKLRLEIFSFSYKDPFPCEMASWTDGRHGGGFVFDCRSLPNPGREERFSKCTGFDPDVAALLSGSVDVQRFLDSSFSLVVATIDNYLQRGFTYLSVGFGCTGGQHRSVYSSLRLAKLVEEKFGDRVAVTTRHYSLERKGLLP